MTSVMFWKNNFFDHFLSYFDSRNFEFSASASFLDSLHVKISSNGLGNDSKASKNISEVSGNQPVTFSNKKFFDNFWSYFDLRNFEIQAFLPPIW